MAETLKIEPTLRVIVAARGLTTTQFAIQSGISPQAVRKALAGKRISHYTAMCIADALNVPLDQIIGLNYHKKGEPRD